MSYEDCKNDSGGVFTGIMTLVVIFVIVVAIGSSSDPNQLKNDSNTPKTKPVVWQSSVVRPLGPEAERMIERPIITPSQQEDIEKSTKKFKNACITLQQINQAAVENQKALLQNQSSK